MLILKDLKRVSGPRPLDCGPRHTIGETEWRPPPPPATVERVLETYKRYVHHKLNPPRVSLLVLRALCHRGRAHPPPGILTRLFSANCTISSAKRKTRQVALPDGPFRLVVAFWIQPLIF